MKKILLGTAFAVALTSFAGQASASLSSLWNDVADDGQTVVTTTSASFNSTHVDSAALDALLGGTGDALNRITAARTLADGVSQPLVQALTDQLEALHAGSTSNIEDEIANIKLLAGDGYIIAPATALPTDLYGIVESQIQYCQAKVAALVLVGGNIVIPGGAAIQATVAGAGDLNTILSALLP